jgi:ribosomal protein S18 acetylase RimI-like enzyme
VKDREFPAALPPELPAEWRKPGKRGEQALERFLKDREPYCVSACSRYLHKTIHDHLWYIPAGKDAVRAFLIYSRRSLFPVLNGNTGISLPRFMNRLLARVPIHAIQGLREDAEPLEEVLAGFGCSLAERIDYDLMTLEGAPNPEALNSGPPALVLRKPGPADLAALLPLQAGYDREEVLPRGAVFNPPASRKSLEHILAREQILAAELDGRIVGKINTNAESFSCWQIGGVYVHPDYRGRGIAQRMTAAFIERLTSNGKKATLFVKKQNPAARAVYRRLGFTAIADYRITYYK